MSAAGSTVVRPPVWPAALAVGIGALAAVQSRVNGALAEALGSGVAAAVVNFAVALAVTSLVLLAPATRAAVADVGRALRDGRLRPWQCLGGLGGAALVTAQATSVPVLGVALFTVAAVAGQTTASLVVDRLGLSPWGPRPITRRRLLSAGLAVLAVAVAVSGRVTGSEGAFSLPLVLVSALAGGLTSVQAAVNGTVSRAVDSPVAAGWLNFAVGGAVLTVVLGLQVLVGAGPSGRPPGVDRFGLYLGGLVGVAFIVSAAVLVQRLGVLVLALGTVAGQVVGAVLVDLVAPSGADQLTVATVVGALLTLVAVGVAAGKDGRP